MGKRGRSMTPLIEPVPGRGNVDPSGPRPSVSRGRGSGGGTGGAAPLRRRRTTGAVRRRGCARQRKGRRGGRIRDRRGHDADGGRRRLGRGRGLHHAGTRIAVTRAMKRDAHRDDGRDGDEPRDHPDTHRPGRGCERLHGFVDALAYRKGRGPRSRRRDESRWRSGLGQGNAEFRRRGEPIPWLLREELVDDAGDSRIELRHVHRERGHIAEHVLMEQANPIALERALPAEKLVEDHADSNTDPTARRPDCPSLARGTCTPASRSRRPSV